MITGVHTMFYSAKPEELRAFLRDKLNFPTTDAGGGWLIFDLPSADMGVHPEDPNYPHAKHNTHAISFFCDDIQATVADLQSKGVQFTAPIANQGYGLVTHLIAPGDLHIQLYQPLYTKTPVKPRSESPSLPPKR
jgi:predicted enzyme related to lactoylglutathione lyase